MKTANNLKKVALVVFIVVGLVHILSGLMVSNNYYPETSLIINRVLDIPFAMTALVYGFISIYLKVDESKRKSTSIALIAVSILIFMGLAYINFLVPDKL